MARSTRDANLENRTNRAGLRQGKRYWRTIGRGLALGYRKGKHGGTWYTRLSLGDNKYRLKSIGIADDYRDADGIDVLDYFHAQERARKLAGQQVENKTRYTVADAIRDYMDWYAAHRKAVSTTRQTCQTHILPRFGRKALADLTTRDIRKWHQALAAAPRRSHGKTLKSGPTDPESIRKRRVTANRILTVLRAALNHAWRDGYAPDERPWRKVQPFANVDMPKVRYLSEAECTRLINAADSDFRDLVKVALLTGCRYGELISMECHDFNSDAGTIQARVTKNGKPRHVPLTQEGQQFFQRLTVGRRGIETVFLRAGGARWGTGHQFRRIRAACLRARIDPPCTFHDLRNTYGALLAMRGVSLQVIANVLGHADTRMTSRHYAHLSPSYVADTIRTKLPAFGAENSDNVAVLR